MKFPVTLKTLGLLTLLTSLATSTPLEKREPTCTDLTIPVTISANNALLGGISLGGLLGSLLTIVFGLLVSGTFNINARYCEPEVFVASRQNTIQFLVHGLSYDKNYWSGLGAPGKGFNGDQYSWVSSASQNGYPTLAIDRLGNGLSDHPDPTLVVQYPAQVEAIHQLLAKVKSGTANLPRLFSKIIYAGHSYGSLLANDLVVKYPTDVDALILTAYSSSFLLSVPGAALNAILLPAAVVEPIRFLGFALGYLDFSNRVGFDYLFFSPGNYDAAVESFNYANRGTVAAGEIATAALMIQQTAYTGPVYMVSGQHDAIFCNPLTLQSSNNVNCGDSNGGFLADTKSLYPRASSFDVFAVPNAGHCWQLHFSAAAAFGTVHDWIAGKGF